MISQQVVVAGGQLSVPSTQCRVPGIFQKRNGNIGNREEKESWIERGNTRPEVLEARKLGLPKPFSKIISCLKIEL